MKPSTAERVFRGALYFAVAFLAVLSSAQTITTHVVILAGSAGAVALGGYMDKTSGQASIPVSRTATIEPGEPEQVPADPQGVPPAAIAPGNGH
jgi:hypothetical protein